MIWLPVIIPVRKEIPVIGSSNTLQSQSEWKCILESLLVLVLVVADHIQMMKTDFVNSLGLVVPLLVHYLLKQMSIMLHKPKVIHLELDKFLQPKFIVHHMEHMVPAVAVADGSVDMVIHILIEKDIHLLPVVAALHMY